MKILKTRSQLRYTLETAHRVIFEPGTLPPSIVLLSPNTGPIATSVTITGSWLVGASSVTFGGVPTTFIAVNNTTITTTVPGGLAAGVVDVIVTTSAGSSPTGASSQFTVTSGPSLDFSVPEDSQYIGTILL